VFGIAHVANEAQPMISNVFINVFDLNIITFFVGGKLFLERNVYTDKGGGVGKGCNVLYL
jgi:hypothetical protein